MSKLKVKRLKVRTHLLYCDVCNKRVQKGTKGIFVMEGNKTKALMHDSCAPPETEELIENDTKK